MLGIYAKTFMEATGFPRIGAEYPRIPPHKDTSLPRLRAPRREDK